MNVDVREIGKKLNVSLALEGSVRKSDNNVRITAQIAGTKTDKIINRHCRIFYRSLTGKYNPVPSMSG